MTEAKISNRLFARVPLEPILLLTTVALGCVQAWMGRYSMNPDGISYLDVGDSFFQRDWAHAVNAWWSPLYPWALGVAVGVTKPSPKWEFPVVHLVNLAIFLIALLAFRFLLRGFLDFRRERSYASSSGDVDSLPDWALLLIAYPIFWWAALEVETVYEVTPDLAVLACVCLAAGMLLRLRSEDKIWKFVAFGLILGAGYWTKTILFPLGLVALAASYWWKRSEPGWRFRVLVAALVFLCACAPLIFLLSKQKHRFTFGDSGKYNYAWYVSPQSFWRNWQGIEPGSGKPAHPTRQVLADPPVFEFDGPVPGTYPPWTDPSYWNEGLQAHFRLQPQLKVLAGTVPSEVRLLLSAQPALVVGILILGLLSGRLWWRRLRDVWPLLAMSLVGLALYLPIVENDRYLGGFLLVLFLLLVAVPRCRPEDQRSAVYVALAVFCVMAIGTADYTVRMITNHYAIPGNGPTSAWQDVVAAEQLWRMGAQPGDKVAVIGEGTGAYWARLAKLRIVAEVMGANHGYSKFWDARGEVQQDVYAKFAQAHAKLVVSSCPLCPAGVPDGWQQVEGTSYCVRRLE